MPSTSVNIGATDGRAATSMAAPGTPRRTSAMAGSAITASPSQLGATTSSRFTPAAAYDRLSERHGLQRTSSVKIALLQINPTVGDLAGNARLIADAARERGGRGADLAVTPELALVGYLPRDLLLSADFVETKLGCARRAGARRCSRAAADARRPARAESRPTKDGRCSTPRHCSAAGASSAAFARRCCRPTTSSTRTATSSRFTARRSSSSADGGSASASARTSGTIATSGSGAATTTIRSRSLSRAGAQAIVNLSASPFTAGKHHLREEMLGSMARRHRVPLVYVNQFGGNDDLVFDGRSCAFDADGRADRPRPLVRRRHRRLRSRARPADRARLRPRRSSRRSGARWSSARATTRASAASRARCSACRAASTRR